MYSLSSKAAYLAEAAKMYLVEMVFIDKKIFVNVNLVS
jgi:hypothetical protein